MTNRATHITAVYRDAFTVLTSGTFDNFALFSGTMNSEPGGVVQQDGDAFTVQSLFVGVTPAWCWLITRGGRQLLAG